MAPAGSLPCAGRRWSVRCPPRCRPTCALDWNLATSRRCMEELMARSRSGTRNTRGPRKPQRRPDAASESQVQTIDPSARGAVTIPDSITVKELAELIGVNAADIIRELIKSGIFASINQVIDRDTASLVKIGRAHV